MYAGLLITLREGIEAFLVVGILLGYLTKINQPEFKRYIWWGTWAGILASVILALLFQVLAIQFSGLGAEVFEFLVSLLAVGVLTWMVLWMQRQSRNIKAELEQKVNLAVSTGQVLALSSLAFMAVLREGLETTLFLGALTATMKDPLLLLGSLFGLLVAVVITYIIFRTTVRLDIKKFFFVSGVLIIFIAAGLLGHAVMTLQELNIVPPIIPHIWDTGQWISDEGIVGKLLHAFIGYTASPSLLQVIVYLSYVVFFIYRFMMVI
ncbi:FTR1 family protein [Candidatus Saganbacteria bacterium]|nr:FTR1 family protein [Candidatus Saganbacteria bacterium]